MTKRLRFLAVALVVSLAVPIVSAGDASAAEPDRRWNSREGPFDDRNLPEKLGSNVRDGVIGVVDSLFQGVLSASAIVSPYGGLLLHKVSTFVGDVIGIVDNNPVTHHVFQGVLSRQLLRLGAGAAGTKEALGAIHDQKFAGSMLEQSDFIGDQAFHTKAYTDTSVLATLCAVVVADILIRPVGGIVTIFGARELGEELNQTGLDMIENASQVNFL